MKVQIIIPSLLLLFSFGWSNPVPKKNKMTTSCQTATIALDAGGMATLQPADVDAGSTPAPGNYLAVSPNIFDCSALGSLQNVRLSEINPGGGEVSACTTTVTVVDNLPPNLSCVSSFPVYLNPSGFAVASPFFLVTSLTDNCGTPPFPSGVAIYDCTDIGGPYNFTFGTADLSGNSASCTVAITVVDDLKPLISCQDIIVSPTQSSGITISPQDLEASASTDNCGINTKSVTPNTFTCADAGNHTAVLTVSDINGNVASCTSIITVDCILPVEWGPVNAIPDGEKVRISWSTLQEINNDYFLVEHSTDGVQFEAIAQLAGKGNQSEVAFYQIRHPSPQFGANYYRIRQVDFDGSYKFSPIVHTQMVRYPSPGQLKLYPNPVRNRLYYQLPGQDLEDFQLQVFNTLGQLMAEEVPEGYLQLDDWPAGAYWLVISGGRDRWQRMFVKE